MDGLPDDLTDLTPESNPERRLSRAMEQLRDAHSRIDSLERQLASKQVALDEVLSQYDHNRRRINEDINTNVKRLIEPIIDRIERSLDERGKSYLELLRKGLEEIVSPYATGASAAPHHLTQRELEVSYMIRNGLSSKEIADQLNISVETVRTQRKSIRRKLGATNRRINLRTFLNNLDFNEDNLS